MTVTRDYKTITLPVIGLPWELRRFETPPPPELVQLLVPLESPQDLRPLDTVRRLDLSYHLLRSSHPTSGCAGSAGHPDSEQRADRANPKLTARLTGSDGSASVTPWPIT